MKGWRGIYRVGKALTKPGAFLHEKAEHAMYSGRIKLVLYIVAVALVVTGMLIMIFSPGSTIHPAMVIFLSLILLVSFIFLISLVVPPVLYVICAVTAPFAYINDRCARKLLGDAGFTAAADSAPNWGLGIQYFIKREQKNSRGGFYRAKYIGR